MSEHHLELVEAGVRSELPLEILGDIGRVADDVGERSSATAVCLGPGICAGGAAVRVQVGEDD